MKQTIARIVPAVLAMAVTVVALNCKKNEDAADHPSENQFNITQSQLDAATLIVSARDTGITGDPYNAAYPDSSISERIRDVHASIPKGDSIVPGSIFVRKTYKYQNKVRGRLLNTTVMVKREAGFFPSGGDYEYMRIPFDPSTDYTKHPNGMLPEISEATCRGSDQIAFATCVTCHQKPQTGPDRLFHR